MSHEWRLRRVSVGFAVLVLVRTGFMFYAVDKTAAAQATGEGGKVDEDLSEMSRKFISLIETGDPAQLPQFWSKSGVTFGIDGGLVSRAQITKQSKERLDLYCFFFDGTCLRNRDEEQRRAAKAPPRKKPLYSCRELLLEARAKELKTSQYQDKGALIAHLRIDFTMGDHITPDRKKILEFVFAKESGLWKLTSVPYD